MKQKLICSCSGLSIEIAQEAARLDEKRDRKNAINLVKKSQTTFVFGLQTLTSYSFAAS